MLPIPNLDDQTYDELLNEAKNVVTSYYPQWTNFNEHDPGITLLELFAMLIESQQYYLDQIGDWNKGKYLKLMGVVRASKRPAEVFVHIESGQDMSLLLGHKLLAGDLCFETAGEKYLLGQDIASILTIEDGQSIDSVQVGQMDTMKAVRFLPFGIRPKAGTQTLFRFDNPLPAGQKLDIYIAVDTVGEMERNPLGKTPFVPPVTVVWQYLSADGWEELSDVDDGTTGFLFDGFVSFTVPHEMAKGDRAGRDGYFLRAVLKEGCYDVPPVITRINMNILRCLQQETAAECRVYEADELQKDGEEVCVCGRTELSVYGETEAYLLRDAETFYPAEEIRKEIDEETGTVRIRIRGGRDAKKVLLIHRMLSEKYNRLLGVCNGFPNQRIDLEDLTVLESPFALLIEDETHKGGYCLWERKWDFASSSPEDRHFVLRSDVGELQFGDGKNGRVPEGRIIAAHYVRTMGSGGNIRKGRINRFFVPDFASVPVTNITEGTGGSDEETLYDGFLEARGRISEPLVAVTAKDYEKKVLAAPGLVIADCKVLGFEEVSAFYRHADKNAVHLVVEPYDYREGSGIEENYRINILNALEPYRMIGNELAVYFAEYVEVNIFVELVTAVNFWDIKERIEAEVRSFFGKEQAGFGAQIVYSKLYGYLEQLNDVLGVRSLSIQAGGAHTVRNRQGDLTIPPHAKAKLGKVEIILEIGS